LPTVLATAQISLSDFLNVLFRLGIALLVGAIVGVERQLKHKPAGLRTHMLVSLGAALFILIPIAVSPQHNPDGISRTIQGIATGVGFLGAGEILRATPPGMVQEEVHGLTSAAAIWVSAALGIAAGCGLWYLAIIGAVLCVAILRILKKVEPHN